jgi:hypothetical protein
MMELHQWVLITVVGVYLILNGLSEFLPLPMFVVLVQSSILGLWVRVLEPQFCLCRAASILHIVGGS